MKRSNRCPNASCAATHSASSERVEPVRREHDRRAAARGDLLHRGRYASRSNGAPGSSATNAPATNPVGPRCAVGDLEHARTRVVVEELHVAGVHVHRGDETGVDRAAGAATRSPASRPSPSSVNGRSTAEMPRIVAPRSQRGAGAASVSVVITPPRAGGERLEPLEQRRSRSRARDPSATAAASCDAPTAHASRYVPAAP